VKGSGREMEDGFEIDRKRGQVSPALQDPPPCIPGFSVSGKSLFSGPLSAQTDGHLLDYLYGAEYFSA